MDPRIRGRIPALAAVASLAVVVGACGQPPARTLEIEPSVILPESVPVGQPLEVTYVWTPTSQFSAPADDYKVFVHLEDPDGRIFAQDDHYPPTPTSQWAPGQPVRYRRWIYPPAHLRPDYVDVHVGLYLESAIDDGSGGRVAVRQAGDWEERPRVHRFYVRSEDVTGMPVAVEGWHEEEVDPAAPDRRWTWMERRGVVAFGNPEGPAVLHLWAHSPIDETGGEPQTIRISIAGRELETFQVMESTPFIRRVDVPASMIPEGDWVEAVIEVDKAFVPARVDPASSDTRELGLQVLQIYLAARGS